MVNNAIPQTCPSHFIWKTIIHTVWEIMWQQLFRFNLNAYKSANFWTLNTLKELTGHLYNIPVLTEIDYLPVL